MTEEKCLHLWTRPLTVDDQRPLCVVCGAVYVGDKWIHPPKREPKP